MSERTSVTPVYEMRNRGGHLNCDVRTGEALGWQDCFHVFHMRKTQLTSTCTDSTLFEAWINNNRPAEVSCINSQYDGISRVCNITAFPAVRLLWTVRFRVERIAGRVLLLIRSERIVGCAGNPVLPRVYIHMLVFQRSRMQTEATVATRRWQLFSWYCYSNSGERAVIK